MAVDVLEGLLEEDDEVVQVSNVMRSRLVLSSAWPDLVLFSIFLFTFFSSEN